MGAGLPVVCFDTSNNRQILGDVSSNGLFASTQKPGSFSSCIRELLDDPEKYIRKAVDWTVREVIKRHYDLGFEWLLKQARRRPTRIARTTLKLASKKLTAQDQEIFLHALE